MTVEQAVLWAGCRAFVAAQLASSLPTWVLGGFPGQGDHAMGMQARARLNDLQRCEMGANRR